MSIFGMAARAAAILSAAEARLRDSLAAFTAACRTRRAAWLLQWRSEHEFKDPGFVEVR